MAKARALDKRRKSIKNIRKITRTMELIATARFKKAMDRASAATAYTKRITALVADLANALRRAEAAHGEHEKRTGGQRDANWPEWYAAYMIAEQAGKELPL